MSNFSASIPVALLDAANATLEAAGFGPDNFSVTLATSGNVATHAGFHCWENAPFQAAVEAITGAVVTVGSGAPNFEDHCAVNTLTWMQPEGTVGAYMLGDQVEVDGRTWESLTDYNVWPPGVAAWREVVSEGYPSWVQPVGAVDAYPLGARVTHDGQDWENTGSAANVWEPGVFGWVVI